MKSVLHGLLAGAVLLVPAGAYAASCGAAKPDAKDAVAAMPDFYKTVIDNETIRVIEVTVPAGMKEKAHSHAWPAIVIEDTQRPGEIPAVRNFSSQANDLVNPSRACLLAQYSVRRGLPTKPICEEMLITEPGRPAANNCFTTKRLT